MIPQDGSDHSEVESLLRSVALSKERIKNGMILKSDGGARDSDGTGLSLYALRLSNGQWYYGIYDIKYKENGQEFWVYISKFGYTDRESAGAALRSRFSADVVAGIKEFLSESFSDPSFIRSWYPRSLTEAMTRPAEFSEDWILF